MLEGAPRRRRCGRATGAASGVVCEDGRAVARARASILATGGAAALWSRTTNPPGSLGRRAAARPRGRAPRSPTSSSCSSTRPRSTGVAGPRGLPRHRGDPRRGRDAARRPTASASSTSSRRATRSPARSAALLRETGAPHVGLDMRASTRRCFPNVVAALREAGPRPRDASCVPVAPAAPLHDGRHRHRPRRARRPCPASTPSASAPAPACTAPTGWRRTRSASASCSAAAPRCAALDEPRRAEPRRAAGARPARRAPSRETREALWRDAGLVRDAARGSSALLDDPHPLARLVAACALAREESRGAHRRPTSRSATRARPAPRGRPARGRSGSSAGD